MRIDPERLRELVFEPRWAAVSKLDVDARTVATWDGDLVRDVRLLVPIDVQALTVGADGPSADEAMVRLPSPVNDPTGQGTGFPAPFADGQPRPAGVHLHWAMPDALLRGRLAEGTGDNRLDLPPLPDRWVVLRALLVDGADVADVRGWVLEADRAVRVRLDEWPDAAPEATPSGAPLAAEALTGTAGGSVTWAATYDSVVDRFSFHDPLDDLDPATGAGPAGATYVVAGWWSKAGLDPLDRVQDQASLDALLHELGWSAVAPWVDAPADQRRRDEVSRLRTSVALTSGTSFKVRSAEAPAPVSHVTKQVLVPATQAVRTDLVVAGDKVLTGKAWWPHATLLHGSVYGVPVLGDVGQPAVDNRPDGGRVAVALGLSDDDVLAALTAPALGPSTPDGRRATERLLGAFTSHSLRELGRPDGVATVEEHEHAIAFGSLPGGSRGDDRLLAGRSGTARRVGRGARAAAKGGVKGTATVDVATRLSKLFLDRKQLLRADEVRAVVSAQSGAAEPAIDTEPRVVARPAPRYHFPLDPLVAVQGAGRSLRHGGDGRVSPDGLLWCRWPHQVIREIKGVARGADVVPTLGNGAVPPEVLGLAQEAVLHSPYARRWVADGAASRSGLPAGAIRRRLDAEAGLRFGPQAVYDGGTQALAAKGASVADRLSVADELWRHSLLVGVDPSPVGVTAWSQPWVPMWLEWEAETELATTVVGWSLDAVDAEPDPDAALPSATTRVHRGRTLLTTGAASTLASAVRRFLAAEDALERSTGGMGEVPDEVESAMANLASVVDRLDILTTTLDGLRSELLGLAAAGSDGGLVRTRAADGTLVPPAPVGPPLPLAAGGVRLTRARLVDAFGRVLDVPAVATAAVPTRAELPDRPGVLRIRPRLPRPARWMFRLIDAGGGPDGTEARVDQVDPAGTVNPVAGFLLPDHLDESLEVFDAAGRPVGELFHESIGGRVVWEIAPGRPGPPDAGPLFELARGAEPLGWLATGLLAADVQDRATPDPAPESALVAALRAIDTTLWTVDTFAALGSEHVAGLVGRPLAVVRASLWLELQPETDLDLSDPARAAERRMAEEALAAEALSVRLGELTRSDDGLVGFFVDDDFRRLHLVDKVVASLARAAGPGGHLGDAVPIRHPYLVTEDTLRVHYGQKVTLTLLLHAGGRVHLTSGILPRKSLALARDWVAPGLARISPSLRTGPVLIDPAQVRLPKPSVFGADQVFTRRSTPATWKDDPILAATQTALLPDEPAHVQDGFIRVSPEPAAGSASPDEATGS